uniref:Uncharacterized protein n=1 Tax=Strongyloides papillosus TaxID=174720 RepID=A0A0N5BD81_STREA
MIIFLIQIFFWIPFISTITHVVFLCIPSCKKFLEPKNNTSSVKTTGNLFGAHNKKVAKDITAVRPATCVSMQPEIIQPAESIRTLKEEEIAKGNVFTKKDNHPTFEDINDDWEPSVEELGVKTSGGVKNIVRDQKMLFKPPKPETSYTKKTTKIEPIGDVKKKISEEILSSKGIFESSVKGVNDNSKKRPKPSKIARTLREEQIARGERKNCTLKEEPTLEEVLDDWG